MKNIKNTELPLNQIINNNCVEAMSELPEGSVDLIVTSPPYSVNIDYDTYNDNTTIEEYLDFSEKWLTEAYRVLKDDGRMCLNLPYEVNLKERGGRIFLISEVWNVMKKIGYGWFGIVDLDETSPHRSKTTAWGSWMSCSQPYIYNPKECLLLAYKKSPKKQTKGTPQWQGEYQMVPNEKIEGEMRRKLVYDEKDKKNFISLVYGQWNYFADTNKKQRQHSHWTFLIEQLRFYLTKRIWYWTHLMVQEQLV